MITVNSIVVTPLAITMVAASMETTTMVEVVEAVDHLIGGTDTEHVITLKLDCFIFYILVTI